MSSFCIPWECRRLSGDPAANAVETPALPGVPSALGLALVILAITLPCSLAQTVTTILTNGPSSNRLNVVFLSEGYTSAQLGQFTIDATNALNVLLGTAPYEEYKNYINAFAISIASLQSGSDHPNYGLARTTYFNSSYDAVSDFLITIPTGSTGQGKVDALLQTFVPKCHLPIMLVNDYGPAGSDGFDRTAIVAAGSGPLAVSQVLPHETGHVLANLGDEYTNSFNYPNTEEPNTTQATNFLSIKWKAWISTNTPLPTPPTAPYANSIGLFEGAHYHPMGWYRPKLNCGMGDKVSAFCEVCAEALVLAIYGKVRPVDAVSPASGTVLATDEQALEFGLSLLKPLTHHLTVQWFTNGLPVAAGTNTMLSLPAKNLAAGANSVSAVVHDPTPLVRTDPTNALTQTVSWAVNISRLNIDNSACLAGGRFTCRFSGSAPQGFVIQASTNLVNWMPILTNSLSSGQYWFTNSASAGIPRRYFRGQLR